MYKIEEKIIQGETVFQIKKRFIFFFWKTVPVLFKSEIEDFPIIWTTCLSTKEQAEFYRSKLGS